LESLSYRLIIHGLLFEDGCFGQKTGKRFLDLLCSLFDDNMEECEITGTPYIIAAFKRVLSDHT
jgi:hypothetical protein